MMQPDEKRAVNEEERRTFFEYYVSWSRRPEPTVAERDSGLYLLEMAEARYLQKFFDPVY